MNTSMNGVALVTGAGSGIGRDCGIAFAAAGAIGVAFADLNLEAASAATEESKSKATNASYRAIAVQVDVSDETSVQNMVDTVIKEFGRLDYSVNSAGVSPPLSCRGLAFMCSPKLTRLQIGVKRPQPVSETDMTEFQHFHDINVKGVMLCIRAVSRVMLQQERRTVETRNGPRDIGRGSIVNVASANSLVAFPAIVQYTAAKHAVLGITKTAALDLGTHGIRVNAVCPSWVHTPMIEEAFADNAEMLTALASGIPTGRLATVEEVSDVTLFLSSHQASYVTGVGWLVDGGATLMMKIA